MSLVLLIVGVWVACSLTFAPSDLLRTNETNWTDSELEILSSLRLGQLPPMPRDPSNRYENDLEAVKLGREIFSDRRFSRNRAVSCSSCHRPELDFQDGLPLGQGISLGNRRTMPLVNAGYSPWFFWDGRKDSLWSQALGPMEDAREHGGTRLFYAHLVDRFYRRSYERVFGPMPNISNLPENASPIGTPEERAMWRSLDDATQQKISGVFANIGKSIAAYEKTLGYGTSRFDQFVEHLIAHEPNANHILTSQEMQGLKIFIGKGNCVSCHNGPALTDYAFHNTGVPPRDPARPDIGRADATLKVQQDEFNCLGPFSDAQAEECRELHFMVVNDPKLLGAFKTPSLRNVMQHAPYMHAGQFTSLEAVLDNYVRAQKAIIGTNERRPLALAQDEVAAVIAFLGTLTSPIVTREVRHD